MVPSARKSPTLEHHSSFAGITKLFVCGGSGGISGTYLSEPDIVDLPPLGLPEKQCKKVPELPEGRIKLFAMWDDADKSILCCGGQSKHSGDSARCFKYSGAEWIDLGSIMRHGRFNARPAKLSDGRYWISGASGSGVRYKLGVVVTCGWSTPGREAPDLKGAENWSHSVAEKCAHMSSSCPNLLRFSSVCVSQAHSKKHTQTHGT